MLDYKKLDRERVHGDNHTFSLSGEPEIYASMTGEVIYSEDGRLDVSAVLVIDGDVEASEPVEFDGKIIITGNAEPGSSITATDDVIILGSAEGAIIRSGGELIVYNGKKLNTETGAGTGTEEQMKDKTDQVAEDEVRAFLDTIDKYAFESHDEDIRQYLLSVLERQRQTVNSTSGLTIEETREIQQKLVQVRAKIEDLAPRVERMRTKKEKREDLNLEERAELDEQMAILMELMIQEEDYKMILLGKS